MLLSDMNKVLICFGVALSASVLIFTYLYGVDLTLPSVTIATRPRQRTSYGSPWNVTRNASDVVQFHPRTSTILIYTSFFGSFPWEGLETSQKFSQFKGESCTVRNCVVTYDRNQFTDSDVIIFHARDLPDHNALVDLHRKRPPGQAWVFYIIESPMHSPNTYSLNELFNWTMTYRRDSDIYHPYGFYIPLKEDDVKPSPSIDFSKGKNKLVVWTVSHCGGMRKSYVDKLREHVQVDVFGACGSGGCPSPGGIASTSCNNILRTYKFQLAFENSYCVDYVTEKYWGSPLELGIVPVVLGGADYKALAIPGSYINVLDFPSPKALADYLMFLDKNNTAYNEYFQWKNKFKLGGCLHGNDLSQHYPWMCELCALANNNSRGTKIYGDLAGFWGKQHCGLYAKELKRVLSS